MKFSNYPSPEFLTLVPRVEILPLPQGERLCCVLTTTVLFRQAHRMTVAVLAAAAVPVRAPIGEQAAVRAVLAALLTGPNPKRQGGRGDKVPFHCKVVISLSVAFFVKCGADCCTGVQVSR